MLVGPDMRDTLTSAKAFSMAQKGETMQPKKPFVRFAFNGNYPPMAAQRKLHAALYADGGLPSLMYDNDVADMQVVGYGQDGENNVYVDVSFAKHGVAKPSFIDRFCETKFLCLFAAADVKYVETSDGRSFDLQQVEIPKVKHRKTKLG